MANTLLIEKETGGYYGFTLTIDGVVQDKIRNMFNDAFGKNNLVTINNSTGANLVKKQNISVFDITLIASGTFTFSDIDAFLVKLIDIGFFDWRLGTGGGGGATRFDDLLDTFQYFGQDGKGVKVNESEQKLETYDIYNYRTITDLEDTYDVGIPNKMLVTDNDGNVALEDKITIPQPFLNSIGSFHYADLATQTTPFTVVANVPLKLLNDAEGTQTNVSNAPYGVGVVWDETNNQIDLSALSVGDLVHLRIDTNLTTGSANQTYRFYANMAIGSGNEWTLDLTDSQKKTSGLVHTNAEVSFDVSNEDTRDFPAEIYVVSDGGGTIVINGWYFEIIRKNINIIDIDGLTDLSATRTSSNVTIESSTGTPAVIGLGNGTVAGVSLNDYTSTEKAKLADTYIKSEVDAKVSDTAYDATSWNGVTGIAPSKNAIRDKIESLASSTKTYNTYFINTATGNNATGVFEDASKPFATIDYVFANFTLTQGVIIFLQGTGQTFAMTGQFQSVNQNIVADESSTNILDFSSNTNTYAKNSGALALITVNMPNGVIRNERSGGTGIIFSLGLGRNTNTNFNVKEIYWNCSTNMTQSTSLANKLQADKISSRVQLCQGISNDIIIQEFVCLASGATLAQYAKNTTINLISGTGSYILCDSNGSGSPRHIITDVTATGGLTWGGFGDIDVTFNNSTITTFNLQGNSSLKTIRGNIKSITSISGSINSTKFINFTANLGTGNMTLGSSNATVSFENCSIKSTNSPIIITAGAFSNVLELKNSAFEVVNAVPLVTGGAGGTNTLKIAGVSTNATMLSDQNGTGVTVTQYTNY